MHVCMCVRACVRARVCVAAAQKMIRCDLATDWAFADKSAPLYAHMESLERLPIPEVKPTLEMYLHSVLPFLTEKEFDAYKVCRGPPARDARSPTHTQGASEAARSLCSETHCVQAKVGLFETELADELQARLGKHRDTVDRLTADKGGSSWLAEWWDNMAYLDYRDSIAFYVSYFCASRSFLCYRSIRHTFLSALFLYECVHGWDCRPLQRRPRAQDSVQPRRVPHQWIRRDRAASV